MKKYLLILLTWVSVLAMQGQILHIDGTPDSIYTCSANDGLTGVDHIYVVANRNEAIFSTINQQPADWYQMPNKSTPVAQGYNMFQDIEDGKTYLVSQGGVRESFAVFFYPDHFLTSGSITVTPSCDGTSVTMNGPIFAYQDTLYQTRYLTRHCLLNYTNMIWAETEWTEQPVTDSVDFAVNQTTQLPKLLTVTDFVLSGDQFSSHFYHREDTLASPVCTPIAIAHHAMSYTTTRGTALENEVERPIQETTIKGSAPLNILFKSNTAGPVDYYLWTIYHYEEQIGTRTESEHRYIFEERGSYTVYMTASNSDGCSCDTTFEDIGISESMLLVPNVFTPNGDGKNDEFRVAYRSLKEFHCWIYNRWGHLVYSWDDPAKGWDGTINGHPAPEGAYYYIIRALGTDARTDGYMSKPAYNRKKKDKSKAEDLIGVYQLSGDINLLRGKK